MSHLLRGLYHENQPISITWDDVATLEKIESNGEYMTSCCGKAWNTENPLFALHHTSFDNQGRYFFFPKTLIPEQVYAPAILTASAPKMGLSPSIVETFDRIKVTLASVHSSYAFELKGDDWKRDGALDISPYQDIARAEWLAVFVCLTFEQNEASCLRHSISFYISPTFY